MKKLFKIFVLIIFITSCKTYENNIYEIKMPNKNSTSYIFNSNLQDVKNAIKLEFYEYKKRYKGMKLVFKEDNDIFAKHIFTNKATKDDAYLFSHESLKSLIFFNDSIPMLYFVSFLIHLNSLDSNHTFVKIITLDPNIIIGLRCCGFADNWRFRVADQRKVEPSTIEEYEILIIIGNALSEKGMPSIIMPDKQQKGIKKKEELQKYIYKSIYNKDGTYKPLEQIYPACSDL
ncbi:MAG: hypothetical protein ACOYOV_03880 [Bacteroidales bacterium]